MLKKLVLLSGKLHSGKNSFCDGIVKACQEKEISCATDLIARTLKEGCKNDFSRISSFLREEYFKLIQLGVRPPAISWMKVKDEHFFEHKTPFTRRLLQIYGEEILRNKLGEDYLINQLLERVSKVEEEVCIVTDVRFPNEIKKARESASSQGYEVIAVRVERKSLALSSENEHISETALDNYQEWDLVIQNSSTLDYLSEQARIFCSSYLS